jgi:hypothetical protein
MNDPRILLARRAWAVLPYLALLGCNAILGTSDPTVEEADTGPAVAPVDEAGPSDATVDHPSGLEGRDSGPHAVTEASDSNMDSNADPTADGSDVSPPCVDACTLHATECMADGVSACVTGTNGCTSWEPMTTCGPLERCRLLGTAATCICQPSICTGSGTACQGNLLAKCGMDSFRCPYVVSTSPCAQGDICSNPAPNANCASTCVSTCTIGQTQCADPSSLQTCGLNPEGCDSYLAPSACPAGQTCSGTVGTASCVCDNTCPAAGVTCNDGALQTCTADSNGCLSVTSSTPCTTTVANATATCVADACSFVCDEGFTLCQGACVDPTSDADPCAASDP